MYKKSITYVNFNGLEVTDELYFNYTKPELLRLMRKFGATDLTEYMMSVASSGDTNKMIEMIEEVIIGSYGVKTEDGRSFIKNADIRSRFENSIAYAELFEILLTNVNELNAFASGIVGNIKVQETEAGKISVVPEMVQDVSKSPSELLAMIQEDPTKAEEILSSINGGNQNGTKSN